MKIAQELKSKQKHLLGALMRFNGIRIDIKDLLNKINSLESLSDREFNREITCKEYFLKTIEKTNCELDELITNSKIINNELIAFICFDEEDSLLDFLESRDFIVEYYDFRDVFKTVEESVNTFTEGNKTEFKTLIDADRAYLNKLQKCVNSYINVISETLEYVRALPEEETTQKSM